MRDNAQLQALTESIEANLKSASTTTTQTLQNLRSLLAVDSDRESIRTGPERPQIPSRTTKQVSKPAKAIRTINRSAKKAQDFDIYETPDCVILPLPPTKRRKLATDTFNTALKCLAATVKERRVSPTAGPPVTNKSPSKIQAKSTRPLGPCSPNRQTKHTSQSCSRTAQEENIKVVADCAAVALDCLRDLDVDGDKQRSSNAGQQEQGGLVLLDKLIGLELVDHASAQATKIHEQYWKRRKDNAGDAIQFKKAPQSHISDYLVIRPVPERKDDYNFLTSYQSQVLRLAILHGSAVISQEFVQNISISNTGSPASLILQGRDLGFLDHDKAGIQLRTVSLALLKLYSIAATHQNESTGCPYTMLGLLVQSLIIKCSSWSHLRHRPDLERDLWTPLLQGMRRLVKARVGEANKVFDWLKNCLEPITRVLKEDNLETIPSSDLVLLLSEVGERAGSFAESYQLLDACEKTKGKVTGVRAMVLLWQKAVTVSKVFSKKDEAAFLCYEEASASLQLEGAIEEHEVDDLLVYGSRLRKACSALVVEFEESLGKARATNVEMKSQICCARILIRLLTFLSKHLTSHLDGSASITAHQSRRRSVLVSLAKSVESVLALEPLKNSKTLLQGEYNEALQQCLTWSHALQSRSQYLPQDDALTAFIQALPVQTSNLFWSRYTHGLETGLAEDELTTYLIRAVAAIKPCAPCVQRAASLGMKLERLAVTHLQAKNVEAARQSYEDAISHYIQLGAAADAVEAALSKSSAKIWSTPDGKSYALGKAIGSHGKLALTHGLINTVSGMWFYDDETLPDIHRSVLLEEQVLACVNQPSALIEYGESFTICIRNMLKLCQGPEYVTYRSRFMLRLLKVTANSSSSLVRQTLSDETIKQLLQSDSSEYLPNYHESIKCCLGVEWLLWNGHNNDDALLQHVKCLNAFLSKISNVNALESSVDDVECCFNQLRSVASYARSTDNADLAMQSLLALKHMIALRFGHSHTSLLPYLARIGTLQSHAGNTLEAAKTFAACREIFGSCPRPLCAEIRWILAYVEYLMSVGNISKVEEMLKLAQTTFVTSCNADEHLAGRKRLDRDSLLSWAARIASQLAFQSGNLAEATQYAVQAFKISSAIWKAIDQPLTSANDNSSLAINDSTMNLISDELSSLTISSHRSTSQRQPRGAAFWDFADTYYDSLANLISISLHNGSYQDALQYGQLLRKVAQSIGSLPWESRAISYLAIIHAKAGHTEEAAALLEQLPPYASELGDLQRAEFCLLQVEALLDIGGVERAVKLLSNLRQFSVPQERINTLQKPVKKGTSGCDRPPLRGKPVAVRPIKMSAKHPAQRHPPVADLALPERRQTVRSRLERFNDRMLMLQNMAYLTEMDQREDVEFGWEADREPDLVPAIPQTVDSRIISGMIMLRNGLHELSSDPVKCVLAETAVALPVRYKSNRKSGRVTLLNVEALPAAPKARKTTRTKTALKSTEIPSQPATTGEKMLLEAQRLLQPVSNNQENFCPSNMLHVAGKIKSKLALLSSTTNGPLNMTSLQLVHESILPKDIILSREQMIIKAEKVNIEREQVFAWPEPVSSLSPEIDNQDSDTHMVAGIPESWSIISLSLAEDQQEMLISKMTANGSPFLLRIPLSRPDIEAEELDEFSFQEAISELHDIITKANSSCHDNRGQGNKESRLEWYAERQALDKRLETLLKNIENIWLGGFRGLMTAERVNEEIVSKFGQTLSQILDQHLPSRQKLAKSSSTKVELHDHVLELFLGLGSPDEQDMDDAITDLLYFVVDILQFSGERNAYDEIDFDAMLVEVLDSLRSCHDLMRHEQDTPFNHTILIIDKELASIPWESLPCMQNHSVSRMPSLSAILERLEKIREQSISNDGYSLSTTQGAYMLNPSSDLISTQTIFQPILQNHLPNYTATIKKAPTESEFEATLHNNDLFLYFGHGAGAQYIRGRKIRSLDQCAVTLLMGCSSAKMTECGKFESYGMPGYYIGGLSGCMAVVGTLWDVTDRDIDRFALRLMVEWGLIPEDELVGKALEKPRKKGQSKVVAKKSRSAGEGVEKRRGKIGLDEAVSKGREACALRYLNGAAPVVYGIPVYLR